MSLETGQLLQMDLSIGDEDWTPTPHGHLLAEVLAARDQVSGRSVLELGAGSGNHTILMLRQGAKRIVATEVSQDLLETTRRNVAANCPEARNVEYRVADWLHTEGEFDVVVCNPPFCKSGKRNRRYFIDSLILDSHKRLRPDGRIVFVQSSMADIEKTLRRLKENGFAPEILDEREGAFRDYYFEDETFMREIESVPNGFALRDGVHHETLFVVAARLY